MEAYVSGQEVTPEIISKSPLLAIPKKLDTQPFSALLQLLDSVGICPGHPEVKFQRICTERKATFSSVDGRVVAYEDTGFSISLNGEVFDLIIRTSIDTIHVVNVKRPHIRIICKVITDVPAYVPSRSCIHRYQ